MGSGASAVAQVEFSGAIGPPLIRAPAPDYIDRYKGSISKQLGFREGFGPIVYLYGMRGVPRAELGLEPATLVRMCLRTRSIKYGRYSSWPIRLGSSEPVWNSARRLSLPDAPGDLFVHIELVERSPLGTLLPLGSAEVGLALLRDSDATSVPLRLERPGRCVLMLRLAREPPRVKTIFFVRHGESVWNRAQARLDVVALASQTDHPLNAKGREQAEVLQSSIARLVGLARQEAPALAELEADARRRAEQIVRADRSLQPEQPAVAAAAAAAAKAAMALERGAVAGKTAVASGRPALRATKSSNGAQSSRAVRPPFDAALRAKRPGWAGRARSVSAPPGSSGGPAPLQPGLLTEAERALCDVQMIASSPLTRAMQTGAIGLSPLLLRAGCRLRLLAMLREKQNLGGFDSMGAASGKGVRTRLEECTRDLYSDAPGVGEAVLSGASLDPAEVQHKWWRDGPESAHEVADRMSELLWQLQFAPEERIALVGHSHFFREIFKAHLSQKFRATNRLLTLRLTHQKLSNCGVLACTFDFGPRNRAYAQLGEEAASRLPVASGVVSAVELMLGSSLSGALKGE